MLICSLESWSMAGCWAAEHRGHFNLCWTGKSMLCCFILFKRCRTCRSQLRCWTCGRRGTFSISWGWRARSRDFGQSSGRLNRTGRRSSTKTFRYSYAWSLTCGESSQCGESCGEKNRSIQVHQRQKQKQLEQLQNNKKEKRKNESSLFTSLTFS